MDSWFRKKGFPNLPSTPSQVQTHILQVIAQSFLPGDFFPLRGSRQKQVKVVDLGKLQVSEPDLQKNTC